MNNKAKTEQEIRERKIITIFRGIKKDIVLQACKSLYDGGIRCVEVTFDQSSDDRGQETAETIELLNYKMGDRMCIGAGTVLTSNQLNKAHKAGAQYIISPSYDSEIVRETLELGLVSIPSALTPSEAVNCYNAGASFVKIFPAETMGLAYIKSIRAPLSHIPMLAVGNINLENMESFLACGIAGVGLGGSIINKEILDNNCFDELTVLAIKFTSIVAKLNKAVDE